MSERGGSVRDARFLSGADIGRMVSATDNDGITTRHVIEGVQHLKARHPFGSAVVLVTTLGGYTLSYRGTDAVTITGADATTPKTAATTPEPAN